MSSCAKVRSYASWLASAMQERDESHGMQHFERVRAFAVALGGDALNEKHRLILELAALSHDVLDHKYSSSNLSALQASMEQALERFAGLDADQIRDVRLVADNVSLSKELRGELDITALQHRGVLRIRDLVSDADKLDALGRRGLQRLAQYQVHLFVLQGQPTSLITNDFLRIQAQAHLLHRPAYLKTKTARWAGERLLHTTRRLLASDAELDAIIERAVAQPAAAARVSPA